MSRPGSAAAAVQDATRKCRFIDCNKVLFAKCAQRWKLDYQLVTLRVTALATSLLRCKVRSRIAAMLFDQATGGERVVRLMTPKVTALGCLMGLQRRCGAI